jgi:choline dehydrogenase
MIVGAGSAGCVLANGLSEDGSAAVLLLEAGGWDGKLEIRIPAAFVKLYRSDVDWGYSTAPQTGLAGREIYFPRGKPSAAPPRSTRRWSSVLHRADYDGWAAGSNSGWAWEDVPPIRPQRKRVGCVNLVPAAKSVGRERLPRPFSPETRASTVRSALARSLPDTRSLCPYL